MSLQVHNMFSSIAKSYDKTNDLLSFGIHRLWRIQSLKFAGLKRNFPIQILDVCCGTGDFLIAAKKRCNPLSTLIGLDFVWNMLPIAKSKSEKLAEHKNITIINGDALSLPFKDLSFDLCTIGFGIRNLDSTPDGLLELKRVLKKGGKAVILEFGTPHLCGFREIFKLYSKYIMPLIGQMASGNREAYVYLPETSAAYPCRHDFCKLMTDANFKEVKFKSFFGGIAYCYVGTKLD